MELLNKTKCSALIVKIAKLEAGATNEQIHQAALSAGVFWERSENATLCTNLIKALGPHKAKAMRKWFKEQAKCNMHWDSNAYGGDGGYVKTALKDKKGADNPALFDLENAQLDDFTAYYSDGMQNRSAHFDALKKAESLLTSVKNAAKKGMEKFADEQAFVFAKKFADELETAIATAKLGPGTMSSLVEDTSAEVETISDMLDSSNDIAVYTPAEVSPQAQRLAEELGIDIAMVEGSGKNGRVTVGDVRKAA